MGNSFTMYLAVIEDLPGNSLEFRVHRGFYNPSEDFVVLGFAEETRFRKP